MRRSSGTRIINGVSLHVEEAGPADGPLLILLHGFPGFWRDWRRQLEPLAAAGYLVVAPDMRGYNLSGKPSGIDAYRIEMLAADVTALAANYGRSSFRLAGHDWGGIVAWWTAITHPQQVESLAILNAPHPDAWRGLNGWRLLEQAYRSKYVAFFQLPLIPEIVLRAGRFAALRRALASTSRQGTFPGEEIERYAEAWSQPGALTAMLNYYRALRHRPRTPQARVTVPTLILWGARDEFLIREIAIESLKLCDRGDIVWFEDATHWQPMEEPEKVNAALTGFFAAA